MTKNLVTICLMVFIVVVVAILGASVFMNQNKANVANSSVQNNITSASTNTTAKSITLSEVAKHSTANDCWTIVNNKVYNVTALIPVHSGGPDKIILYCGKDATVAFNTKDGAGSHSQRAQNALETYFVGDLSN